ncbi:hypothetical protein CMEL01_04383 [Colletotrichum melonis]|uniref:Zn(2)-C6 fungal-type domain-containing protein n=1 Tax=Colletotrichum melonis TaxID=1209925 RepID=A0AAI9UC32_9PEZI|nr:hypothetical protein CMEL01_04383 [Colletotrichum melonis]
MATATQSLPIEDFPFDFDMPRTTCHEGDSREVKNSTTATKRRRGPLTRNACKHCRIKKLKCSGEKQGCGRCRANGFDCHYETSNPNSKRRLTIADFTPSMSPWEREDNSTADNAIITEEDQDLNDPENIDHLVFQPRSFSPFQAETLDGMLSTNALDSFMKASGNQPFMKATLNSPSNSPRLDPLLSCLNASDWPRMISLGSDTERSIAHVERRRKHIRESSSHNQEWPRNRQRSRHNPSKQHPEQDSLSCSCYARVFLQHEDVSSNLLWSIRSKAPAPPAEMLRSLKRTMEGLDSFFDCHTHSTRPEFVALLVSMCDMMLGGVEYLVPKLCVGDDITSADDDSDTSSSHGDSGRRSSSRSGSVNVTSQPAFRLSQGTLDKEDELHVLHSLVRVRTKRLGLLIDRLYHAVDDNGRPIHRHTVCSLQDRLRFVSSTLKRSQI